MVLVFCLLELLDFSVAVLTRAQFFSLALLLTNSLFFFLLLHPWAFSALSLSLQDSMPLLSGTGVALLYPEFLSSMMHTGTLSGVREVGTLDFPYV